MWQANCSNYQKENHMIKSFNIESNEKVQGSFAND